MFYAYHTCIQLKYAVIGKHQRNTFSIQYLCLIAVHAHVQGSFSVCTEQCWVGPYYRAAAQFLQCNRQKEEKPCPEIFNLYYKDSYFSLPFYRDYTGATVGQQSNTEDKQAEHKTF